MVDNFWLLFLHVFGTDPWPTLAAILTHSFAGCFHLTNALLSVRVFRRRSDLRDNRFIWFFLISNAICAIGRGVVVWGMAIDHHAPSPTLQLISSLLSIMALGSLWFLVPTAIKLPSFSKIDSVNKELASKVEELERERLEKEQVQERLLQAQKMDAIGRLTGGIAHDFNNLLMGISGNLELIRNRPNSPKLDRWLGTGIDAVARAAHLTSQLLTFSRQQKLQIEEVKLLPIMTGLKETLARTIGPDIQINLASLADVTVKTDKVQLELAIINLSINARDAMNGGGTLTLSAITDDDAVEINVSDTGTGIPPEIANRIFEPFFTTKEIGKGTGLGLSMVYGLAQQSNGEAFVKKTSPKGTTITISLPVIVPAEPEETEQLLIETVPLCGSRDILLVDDDPNVREALGEILDLLGHRVVSCHDGMEALVHLKNAKPDLMIIDYAMPVMNGAQVVKSARVIHPELEVIFITGYSVSEELEGQTVLKKPFKIADIRKHLQDVFHCADPI